MWRQARLAVVNTLKVGREAKAMSGRGREGVPGGGEREDLEEEEAHEGSERRGG